MVSAVIFASDMLCLIPKIFNAVNVVPTVGKFLGMVDAVMDKTAYARLVIAAQAVGINNTVRHDFLSDNRHQSIGLGIICVSGCQRHPTFPAAPRPHLPLRRPPK